jgi:S-disulfanyl-L-cysteine oxidoreductase SoxD
MSSFLLLLSLAVAASPQYNVGRLATPEEIATADVSVLPNGLGLPAGQGSARDGKDVYASRCAACHGVEGEGRAGYPPLVGGRGSMTSAAPLLTVGSYWPYATTVWDYVRRAMPYEAPGSLTADEVYALTAWILTANGIIEETAVLDQHTLPLVQMPNRDGFTSDPRPDVGRKR